MKEYLEKIGVDIEDLRVDDTGKIYILIEGVYEGTNEKVDKEINLPEEYQTPENVKLVPNHYDCDICQDTGEIGCMEAVYLGEPHMANVGTQLCECRLDEDRSSYLDQDEE